MSEERTIESASYGLHCPVCASRDLQAIVENQNENYWICSRCGHKFRRLQDLEFELQMLRSRRRNLLVGGLILYIILVLAFVWGFFMVKGYLGEFIVYVSGVIFIATTLILLGKTISNIINIVVCKKELDHVRKSFLH